MESARESARESAKVPNLYALESDKPATNMAEITVDTSNSFVDVRQQDSGSNQSGSDSGLGYTNSLSSDYSTFQAPNHETHHQQAQNNITTDINNNNNSNSKQNNTSSNNASLCSNKSKANESFNLISNETGTKLDDSLIGTAQLVKQASNNNNNNNSNNNNDTQFDYPITEGRLDARNELVPQLPVLLPPPLPPPSVPVIKSLLKKSSTPDAPKHNRNVSFNQTVIVFCEELEASSPSDQYDPQVSQQDPLNSFEPPKDFCDEKVDRKDELSSSVRNQTSTSERFNQSSLINDGTTNLTDDQLIGLLENESLLDSFKLNCEDFSEDEFPINYLNSNHSYLCNDAVSDYDSDSESSLCIERRRSNRAIQTNALFETNSKHKLDHENLERSKSSVANSVADDKDEEVQIETNCTTSDRSNKIKPSIVFQKSMPARMKVSTVDNSHLKKHANRKSENDLIRKLELANQSLPNKPEQQQQQLQQQTSYKPLSLLENTRPNPMLIKQTNVEPVPISKPVIVANNSAESADKEPGSGKRSNLAPAQCQPQQQREQKLANQIKSDQNHVVMREAIFAPKAHVNQSNINTNQTSPPTNQSLPACHICRSTEPNRTQGPHAPKQNLIPREEISKPVLSQIQQSNGEHLTQVGHMPKVGTIGGQPTVYNQSCVSCREALVAKNIVQDGLPARTAGIAQPDRPVAYQLVYVVDPKDNRVRALTLRPASQNVNMITQQPSNCGRIFIAQNGVRFRNPTSIGGQIVNMAGNQLWAQRPPSAGNNPTLYRIVGEALPQQALTQQQLNTIKAAQGLQRVPVQGLGLRQHTVYYVRQPLDTQNIRQSFDSAGSALKSFPDPHEIRRLDGLKGPTAALNLSHRLDHNDSSKLPNQQTLSTNNVQNLRPGVERDETADDPTFGFSKRPSVKVVAANSSQASNFNIRSHPNSQNQAIIMKNEQYSSSNNTANRRFADQSGYIRPISLVVMGSQTLDRRHVNANQQFQTMKENIPSTSSMSNIHGTLATLPNKVSTEITSQQQRISTRQTIDLSSSKSKEPSLKKLDDVKLESAKGVPVNPRIAAPPSTQGRQFSNLNGKDGTQNQVRKPQDLQTEVVYSMNI